MQDSAQAPGIGHNVPPIEAMKSRVDELVDTFAKAIEAIMADTLAPELLQKAFDENEKGGTLPAF